MKKELIERIEFLEKNRDYLYRKIEIENSNTSFLIERINKLENRIHQLETLVNM